MTSIFRTSDSARIGKGLFIYGFDSHFFVLFETFLKQFIKGSSSPLLLRPFIVSFDSCSSRFMLTKEFFLSVWMALTLV